MPNDLFNSPELLPNEIKAIIKKFKKGQNRKAGEKMLQALKPYGYSFEWNVNNKPVNLIYDHRNRTNQHQIKN
jgi:hypothetical protein